MKLLIFGVVGVLFFFPEAMGWDSSILYQDGNGRLVYESDEKGNRLADFSHAGYHSGEDALPNIPVWGQSALKRVMKMNFECREWSIMRKRSFSFGCWAMKRSII